MTNNNLINALVSLSILSLIIIIHELGHFLSAAYFNIPIQEFSIGIGPKIISFKGKLAQYSLRLLPIGGYVEINDEGLNNEFSNKKFYVKFLVILSGVLMNLLLTFSIHLFLAFKESELRINPAVVKKLSNIEQLKLGDKITKVNNIEIQTWQDIIKILENINDKVKIEIKRGNEIKEVEIRTKEFLMQLVPTRKSLLNPINIAFNKTINDIVNIKSSIKRILTRKNSHEKLSGPIGIIKIIGSTIPKGTNYLLLIIAYISLNIAIVNLLPLPTFDGGKLIFVILETIGIKVNKQVEEFLYNISFILLIILTLIVGRNDIIGHKG